MLQSTAHSLCRVNESPAGRDCQHRPLGSTLAHQSPLQHGQSLHLSATKRTRTHPWVELQAPNSKASPNWVLGLRLGFLCFVWTTTTIVLGVCILGFCCFLFFFFSGEPDFPPVKAKGICMYFQKRVSSSLTHSFQGFALESTELFQHHCYQQERDARPPQFLTRSDCKNKHIMALQTLTDALVSVGLSTATAIGKHPWETAWRLRGKTEKGRKREAKLDKVKCSSSALPYFLLFKIQLREKISVSGYIILGNNLTLCFITFSLNKICTAWARYDCACVGLHNLLYETDLWTGKLWNFYPKRNTG